MDDYEQGTKWRYLERLKLRVDTPTVPPLTGDETGDEGGVTPFSENSLHFKMILVPWGSAARASYRSQTLSLTQPPAQVH